MLYLSLHVHMLESQFSLQDLCPTFALLVKSMCCIILVSGSGFVSYFVLQSEVTGQCCGCRLYFKCSFFDVTWVLNTLSTLMLQCTVNVFVVTK